jgi:hypothetical protein
LRIRRGVERIAPVRVIVRTGIGYLLFAGGMTFFIYGIAQAIQTGNCGTDFAVACPSGFGPMILLTILGVFMAIAGVSVAAVSGSVVARLVLAAIVASLAGVVLGIVDLDDGDSRPGLEIVAAVLAPVALLSFPGPKASDRPRPRAARPSVPDPPVDFDGPAPEWQPRAATHQTADQIAERLRQLDQLRQSGLLDDAAYKERRQQILAEL